MEVLQMNFKILKWKILLYKIKIYGNTMNVMKQILQKHDIKFIRLLYSAACRKLVDVYDEVLEKNESSSIYQSKHNLSDR